MLSRVACGLKKEAKRGLVTGSRWLRSYSSATEDDVKVFRSICGDHGVIWRGDGEEAAEDLEERSSDWTKKWRGHADVLVKPHDTSEVSAVLKHCFERDLGVIPVGGNTGLVGGAVPVLGTFAEGVVGAASGRELGGGPEVLVSLERMHQVRSFDESSGVLCAEAGMVLEAADDWLRKEGFCMPLDLGAKGSCQLGGNVSTHAGGLRVVRWGALRGSVLGLEVVLADGTVLDMTTSMRKDNTGFSLSQMFVGSEGSMGVVTAVSLSVPRAPNARFAALLAAESYEGCLAILDHAKKDLGEILSAAEFWDAPAMRLVLSAPCGARLRDPLDEIYPFYVLIETQGAKEEHDSEKLEEFLQTVLSEETAVNGVLADGGKAEDLFAIRESITEALGQRGPAHKYDFSLPLPHLYKLVQDTRNHLQSNLPSSIASAAQDDENHGAFDQEGVMVVGYGHLGDANVHLNISVPSKLGPKASKTVHDVLEPWAFHRVLQDRGSISAEHGLGSAKGGYLALAKDPAIVQTYRLLKKSLDPKGILNPGKGIDAPDIE